jgi:copper resistance protein B
MKLFAALVAAAILVAPAAALAQMSHGGGATEAAPFGNPIDDQHIYYHAILNQLEGRFGADNGFRWEGEAWAGTDTNRLWLKSEGTTSKGDIEDGQHELLYDRPISTYFDLQGGIRLDADSRSGRSWAAFGVEGLAPQFFHVSATGYVSSDDHYAAKLEGDYDLLLTQQLILQPQLELNFYSKSDPKRSIGAGLSELDAGLRLRYEFSRKFAPYIAMTYENSFGGTADFARTAGEAPSALRFAAGVRIWF